MTARRVLILYRDSLLAQGLESLLRQQTGLETSATQLEEANVEELVRHFAPDVIIVDRDELAVRAGITVDRLLREPHLRVIAVSSRDDVAQVYEGHEVRVAKLEDLLATFANETG